MATARKRRKAIVDDVSVTDSTGDVFADIGLTLTAEDRFKLEMVSAIAATLRRRKLTQAAAAAIIGVDQGRVSQLLSGRVDGFSIERLSLLLRRLGRDISVKISREHPGREGRVTVRAARAA